MKRLIPVLLLVLTLLTESRGDDLSTLLMKATFMISDGKSVGTCFIIGRPLANDPNRGSFVLVTANHVLAGMPGETATLTLRRKNGDDYAKLPHKIPIRKGKKPL